jgi:hypothetical protein
MLFIKEGNLYSEIYLKEFANDNHLTTSIYGHAIADKFMSIADKDDVLFSFMVVGNDASGDVLKCIYKNEKIK